MLFLLLTKSEETDTLEAAGDPELERLFEAAVRSKGENTEMTALFVYLFETLPKLLE